ncbi:MAG: hypothetical protein ACKVG0_04180 [Alphaproteobacteria bacterium]
MAEIGLQSLFAWTLASQFAVLGLLNIAAPEKLHIFSLELSAL